MVGSSPLAVQPAGTPLVWSRLVPTSKAGLGQKLFGRKSALRIDAELITANSARDKMGFIFIRLVFLCCGLFFRQSAHFTPKVNPLAMGYNPTFVIVRIWR